MSEWFYDTLQATAGMIDPTVIEPYEWMDIEFGRKGTRGGEVLVGPCDLEHVSVIAYIGSSQLDRIYRLSVENNDLVIELTDTCFNGVGEEALSQHDLAQIEGFEEIFDLQKELSKKGDNARCQADKMRSEMITALRMFKKIAPQRALPLDVQYLGDEPDVGYSLGM